MLTANVACTLDNVVTMLENSDACSAEFAERLPHIFKLTSLLKEAQGVEAEALHRKITQQLAAAGVKVVHIDDTRNRLAKQAREEAHRVANCAALMGQPSWINHGMSS